MKTQRIKTLLLFLSMIPFIGIYAQSIYYVSPHASSGGDGSQSAPFHSIHEAVEKPERIKIALQFTCGRGNMF